MMMAAYTDNDYEILITGSQWPDSPIKASVVDVTVHLKEWVAQHQDERVVFAVKATYNEELGWHLQVTAWDPDVYQGRPFPTKTLSYVPSIVPWEESKWVRGKASGELELIQQRVDEWKSKRCRMGFLKTNFDSLFRVVMGAEMPCILVESLGHDTAVEAFYQNVRHNTSLRRIEVGSVRELETTATRSRRSMLPRDLRPTYSSLAIEAQKRFDRQLQTRLSANRIAKLCTKLLKNGDLKSLKELVFFDLGACGPRSARKMLGAVQRLQTLETLDLRVDRRIHTWDKAKKRTELTNKTSDIVCIQPLVAGLANCKALKTLDLSGNRLSNESVYALITSLPAIQTLSKLLLRDTCLSGSAMLALADVLKDGRCGIRELDVSHNEAAFDELEVMQELCASLKPNTALRSLRLENCDLKLSHCQVLAEVLPDIEGLQQLSLDGNWENQIPSFATGDDYSAYLAEGPGILVDALEANHSLLTLGVGAHSRGKPRCAPPSYCIYKLGEEKLAKLRDLLKRNNEAFNEKKKQAQLWKQKVELPKTDHSYNASWLVDSRKSCALVA